MVMNAKSNEQNRSLNLLVAEDEAMLREILVDVLAPLNCSIFQAENGEEALKIIQAKSEVDPITAVLTDINMPKMNGFQFMEAALKSGIQVPFIFLTAYGDKENMVKALRLGAFDFLEKPFDQKILLGVLQRALEVGSQTLSLESSLENLFRASGLPEAKRKEFNESRRALEKIKIEKLSLTKKAS
jgi:DNA-binding NtrC family response regulator